MTNGEAVNWIINISADIGKAEHRDLWHYEQALLEIKEMLESQPERKINCVGDLISREFMKSLGGTCIAQRLKDGDLCPIISIDLLPSAEPEVIVCGDCKHWIRHDRRCGYWNHGVKPLDWCCHAERISEAQEYLEYGKLIAKGIEQGLRGDSDG